MNLHKVLFGLLTVLLVIQITLWAGRQGASGPSGPVPGSPFPRIAAGSLTDPSRSELWDSFSKASGCVLLVYVSPTCGACARMRVTWPGRFGAWADSVPGRVRAVWLSEVGEVESREFVGGFSLDGIEILHLFPESAKEASRDLGIVGTPTTFLIDSDGVFLVGMMGDVFPPIGVAQETCG